MALPQHAVKLAMITSYRGDTALQALMTQYSPNSGAASPTWNIFDAVPINQAFPYVVLNTISGVTGIGLTMPYGKAKDLLVQIDVFSQYQGTLESEAIASRIDDLTDEISFTLTGGFNNFMTMFTNSLETTEPDGITRRMMLEYRVSTQG